MIFKERLENLIQESPELARNSDIDNNNIMLILIISNLQKVIKLVVFIGLVSYFLGMLWYIYCNLTMVDRDDEHEGFIKYFDLEEMSDYKKGIVVTYWAFTTLSTVGFGDYYPRSNAERLLCAFILLFGVNIFSYIMGNYILILNSLKSIGDDF